MKNKNKHIIGFAGRARSGKTHLSELLSKESNAKIFTIAKYLKLLCCEILKLDNIGELNRLKNNNTVLNYTPKEDFVNIIHLRTGISTDDIITETSKIKSLKNVRNIMQFIGTDIIRKFYSDWHIDQLINEITLSDEEFIIIDDVRFPNEVEALQKIGGKIYFIIRTTDITPDMITNHSSETALKWYNFPDENIILNTGDLNSLNDNFISAYRNNFENNSRNPIFLSSHKEYIENPLVIEDLKNRIK